MPRWVDNCSPLLLARTLEGSIVSAEANQVLDAFARPIPQPSPSGDPETEAKLLGEPFRGDTAAPHNENGGQAAAVGNA